MIGPELFQNNVGGAFFEQFFACGLDGRVETVVKWHFSVGCLVRRFDVGQTVTISTDRHVLVLATNNFQLCLCAQSACKGRLRAAIHTDGVQFHDRLGQWDQIKKLWKGRSKVRPVQRGDDNNFSFVRLIFGKVDNVRKKTVLRRCQ